MRKLAILAAFCIAAPGISQEPIVHQGGVIQVPLATVDNVIRDFDLPIIYGPPYAQNDAFKIVRAINSPNLSGLAGIPGGEFVEIMNVRNGGLPNSTVNIGGYWLMLDRGTAYRIPYGTWLKPKQRLVIDFSGGPGLSRLGRKDGQRKSLRILLASENPFGSTAGHGIRADRPA